MTEIAWVFGTRPELVKIAPVVRALKARNVAQRLIATGQHKDLLDPSLLAELGEVESLGLASDGSVVRFLADARDRLRGAFDRRPAIVAVQGDTMSAFAGASLARSLDIPVAHVEAGVRSGNRENPWPEEMIRREIDAWATWRYAPTMHCGKNLLREDIAEFMVCGNTSVDNLMASGVVPRREDGAVCLVTLHRRELRQRADARELVQGALNAMGATAAAWVWPVHPGMHEVLQGLSVPANVTLRPPFDYRTLLDVLAGVRGVLTDSGGLVEEAATLGVPTVILRDANDRPEACEAGIAAQCRVDVANIGVAVEALALGRIADRKPCAVYGDGRAGGRIALHLAQSLQGS